MQHSCQKTRHRDVMTGRRDLVSSRLLQLLITAIWLLSKLKNETETRARSPIIPNNNWLFLSRRLFVLFLKCFTLCTLPLLGRFSNGINRLAGTDWLTELSGNRDGVNTCLSCRVVSREVRGQDGSLWSCRATSTGCWKQTNKKKTNLKLPQHTRF